MLLPDLTVLLRQAKQGDAEAAQIVLSRVYGALESIARTQLRTRRGHTIQTSDLVHEAYFRLFGNPDVCAWSSRKHFLAVASKAMRSILVDYARRKNSARRKASGKRIPLEDLVVAYERKAGDLEALDEALSRFGEFDAESARLIELRFFGGLTVEELSLMFETPKRTVERRLRVARAWLRRELRRGT